MDAIMLTDEQVRWSVMGSATNADLTRSVTANTSPFPNQERRRLLFLRQGALDDAQTPSKCLV